MSVLFSKELRKDVENSEFIVPLSSKLVRIPICRTQIYENIDLVANKYLVKRKGILGQHGRFCEIPMYLAEFNGAYITDVERQSISNRHKYLQAIADLEIENVS